MFTTIDKAITALIMAILSILSFWHLLPFTVSDSTASTVGAVIAALSPLFVYLVPNKKT